MNRKLQFLKEHNFSTQTKISAVIGDPVSHSLSPHLHNYLLKKYKIDGTYLALQVSTADFPEFLKTIANIKNLPNADQIDYNLRNGIGFVGCNITIPHKETALKLCDELSESATQIGAVNTIVLDDGKIIGDNSDHYGFIQNIKNTHPNFSFKNDKSIGKKALVLGAGGAARAIVYGLIKEGVEEIFIANRNLEKAKDLAKDFSTFANKGNNSTLIKTVDWQNFNDDLEKFDLLINTTALGMARKDGETEELEIDLRHLKKSALVCDIVYKPLMTNLLKAATAQGNPIVTGIGMLVYQGLVGFEKWFNTKPDQALINRIVRLTGRVGKTKFYQIY